MPKSKPTPARDVVRIELQVAPPFAAKLDKARGIASRSAYVRQAIEEKIAREGGR